MTEKESKLIERAISYALSRKEMYTDDVIRQFKDLILEEEKEIEQKKKYTLEHIFGNDPLGLLDQPLTKEQKHYLNKLKDK